MCQHYRQLTPGQRYQIAILRAQGQSLGAIGAAIGVHKSTISRELRRNAGGSNYQPAVAQRRSDQRRREATKSCKNDAALRRQVDIWLRLQLSPEQIAGRLVEEGAPWRVSHAWVYRLIARDRAAGGTLYRHLRQSRRRRRKRYGSAERRGRIRHRVGIEARPAIVDQRCRPGDWEGDTVQAEGGHLVTLVDRHSGLTLIGKVKRRSARAVRQCINRLLANQQRHTLTLDNGREFADHARIRDIAVYFATPYSSWQRGSNENANGLIRQYLPKGESLAGIGEKTIEKWMLRLNTRPRKRLGWKSPLEVHCNTRVALML